MKTLLKSPGRGRPRQYADTLECDRQMTARRAARLYGDGKICPGWWYSRDAVELIRQAKQLHETIDDAADRVINIGLSLLQGPLLPAPAKPAKQAQKSSENATQEASKKMGTQIKGVVFDVYGTIAEIRDQQRPFKQLFNLIRDASVTLPDDYAERLMSRSLDLQQAAQLFNVAIAPEVLDSLNQALERELQSIALFSDTVPALTQLKEAGFKLGLCSNLAMPYAQPIEQLLPFGLDAYGWSFEVGTVKPDPAIYHNVCQQLGLQPEEVLMVGDTLEADVLGPRSIGMQSVQIVRNLAKPCDGGLRSLTELAELLQCKRPDICNG